MRTFLLTWIACGAAACGHRSGSTPPPAIDAAIDASIDAPIDAPVVSLAGCTTTPGGNVVLRKIAPGCGIDGARPPNCMAGDVVLVTSPPGDPRLFVLEQAGRIRLIDQTGLVAEPFLDLGADVDGPVVTGGELGLLGLAFDPQFATNRQFYVYYTANNVAGAAEPYLDILARYTASATDPTKADPASAQIILAIPDKYSNHNGGMVEFGADKLLYVGDGDGGSGSDPDNNGQNPNVLLGKIMRLDVAHPADGKPYGIPDGNPYKHGGGAPEILITGVRNPWRWSFDRATGDLWIGDVGQGRYEEVDVLAPAQLAGANLGWAMYEGPGCWKPPCDPAGKIFAQDNRTHTDGWLAIIGGQVYRGACYPDLVGSYFYSDYGKGGLVKARLSADRASLDAVDLVGTYPAHPTSIHADSAGELYETDTSGNVWHLEAAP